MLLLLGQCNQEAEEEKVKLLGIAICRNEEELEQVRKLVDENKLTLDILVDRGGKAVTAFRLPTDREGKLRLDRLPSTLIIARPGKVVYWEEGYNLNIAEVIKDCLPQIEKWAGKR
jgi:peroxiredoxin